jgi:hypothetical protein
MATLFNTKIKDTYQSLLKLEDNTILTTTTKNITDGLGNASPLFMSTTQVRIGSTSGSAMYWDNVNNRLGVGTSTPTEKLDIVGNIKGTSNLVLGDAAGGSGGGFQAIRNANIYSSFLVHSQSKYLYLFTNPQGYSTGGFPASSTGMYSLGSIVFMPDGATAVTMLTNGNVLIGTTTDSGYKLDVNGTARLGVNGGYVTVTSYTPGATTMSVSNFGHHGATAIFASSAVGINAISVLGAGSGTPLGVGVAARKVISPLVDTFTDADGVVNSTYKSIGLYAERAIISNSGSAFIMTNGTMLHVDGATVMSGSVTANSIPASPNTAYGLNIKNTLVAAANNDRLVALDINPTFTNGAFTGVNNYNIKTRGLLNKMYFQSPTTNQGRHDISFGFGGSGEQVKLIASATGGSGQGNLYIASVSGDSGVATTSDANVVFGTNGNTFYKTFTLLQNTLTSGNGLYLSGNQQNGITNGIYFTFSETRVAILSKPNGGSGYADFRIAIVPLGGGNTNNPPQLSDTKFMITQDTTNVLINTTTDSGYKLDVNGTARVNGVLTVGNSTITGNFGAMTLSNSGTAGVSLSFTNSRWGSDNPCNFGDQGTNAHSSAQVEVRSSGRGFLPPRMTFTQRNAIATPATGLQVFDTNQNAICEYTGTAWRTISGGKQVNNATTGATTIDLSAGNVADVTLTLSTVITLTNPTVGTYVIKLIQDAIGGKVVSWPFNVLWSGGTPPTLTATANKTDVITLMYDGVNYYGTYALNF